MHSAVAGQLHADPIPIFPFSLDNLLIVLHLFPGFQPLLQRGRDGQRLGRIAQLVDGGEGKVYHPFAEKVQVQADVAQAILLGIITERACFLLLDVVLQRPYGGGIVFTAAQSVEIFFG